jgi:hypothetical protein
MKCEISQKSETLTASDLFKTADSNVWRTDVRISVFFFKLRLKNFFS